MTFKRTAAVLSALLSVVLLGCAPAPVSPAARTTETPTATATPDAQTPAPTTQSEGAYAIISPQQAYETMGDAVLLDVRTAEEYAQAHIPGAYLLPVEELETRALAELPKDRTYYVYCRTGRRSAIAANALLSLGYARVYDLGGIVDWPYETETGEYIPSELVSRADATFVPVDRLEPGEVLPDDDEAELPDLCGSGDECQVE